MEKREPSYTVDQMYGGVAAVQTVWLFLRKLNTELLHALAILTMDINPDKTVIQKDTCTPMLTAALVTIVKAWKQPK